LPREKAGIVEKPLLFRLNVAEEVNFTRELSGFCCEEEAVKMKIKRRKKNVFILKLSSV
jgi:hypothetical protein